MKTTKSSTLEHSGAIPETYAALAQRLLPRPIHNDPAYRDALGILDSMAGFELNADQEDYLDAIATFVEKYESQRFVTTRLGPRELLRALIKEHGLSESDLGRLLGDRSLGHRILSGERALSKAHIRILCDTFSLHPGALLEDPAAREPRAR